MASRPELIRLCKELEIDYEGLSTEGMRIAVQDAFDAWYGLGDPIGNSDVSDDLLKFVTEEHNYVLKDKHNNFYSYEDIIDKETNNET